MVRQPEQRYSRRSAMPPTKSRRPVINNKVPKLRPVEQTLYILISEPHLWHLVDEFKGKKHETSAMEASLRRRGVTVQRIPHVLDKDIIQVWCKWEHEVPTDVAPWMVRHSAKATK